MESSWTGVSRCRRSIRDQTELEAREVRDGWAQIKDAAPGARRELPWARRRVEAAECEKGAGVAVPGSCLPVHTRSDTAKSLK